VREGQQVPREEPDWSIGMWRDEKNPPTTIACPPDKHAVVLKLTGLERKERTFDGRLNNTAIGWELKKQECIGLHEEDATWVKLKAVTPDNVS
jgi:hypothetical protein